MEFPSFDYVFSLSQLEQIIINIYSVWQVLDEEDDYNPPPSPKDEDLEPEDVSETIKEGLQYTKNFDKQMYGKPACKYPLLFMSRW